MEVATLADRERAAIVAALAATDGHRERAAALLGIGVATLYRKLKRYGIRKYGGSSANLTGQMANGPSIGEMCEEERQGEVIESRASTAIAPVAAVVAETQ